MHNPQRSSRPLKSRRHRIEYHAPALRWDEGLPCGNGTLGLLVWGDGSPLNFSLDRSDLWDERPDPGAARPDFRRQKLVEYLDRNDMQAVESIFEIGPDVKPHPTKLPCGRLQLDFGKKTHGDFGSTLDLRAAITTTRIGDATVTAYVQACQPLIVVRATDAAPRVRFLSPFDSSRPQTGDEEASLGSGDVASLGYPPLQKGRIGARETTIHYARQQCAQGMSYAVAWLVAKTEGEWALYLTVQRASDDEDPLPQAVRILQNAQETGTHQLEKTHRAWWREYWRCGRVRLPDARLEKLWHAEMYKLAATAREGTPPISLQGVWTADEMSLPPWHGDFHHDLNTEMSYWPVHTAGRVEQSRAFCDWLLEWLPRYRDFARRFYDAPGACVIGTHSLAGHLIRGWAAYCYSPANGAWLLQHLWWHYRYALDDEFLREVYPFIADVTRFIVSRLEADASGVYHLNSSSSPEYFGNTREAFARDSTYDLSLIRHALTTACDAAGVLGTDADEAEEWRRIEAKLQPYPISSAGGLAIWEGQGLSESHRHHSHLMPIFPIGDLNIENDDAARTLIQNSLHELETYGTGFWTGYSFAWLACIGARVREPNRVLWALGQYLDAFVAPNTFHLNGDFKKLGTSRFHYRPFTQEGGFAAAHAINEMLLQSWGEKIRLFPAVPADWQDVAFTELKAEGAFTVSAWRENGEFAGAEILSEKGATLCLEHPHPHRAVWMGETGARSRQKYRAGREIRFPTRAGAKYEFSIGV